MCCAVWSLFAECAVCVVCSVLCGVCVVSCVVAFGCEGAELTTSRWISTSLCMCHHLLAIRLFLCSIKFPQQHCGRVVTVVLDAAAARGCVSHGAQVAAVKRRNKSIGSSPPAPTRSSTRAIASGAVRTRTIRPRTPFRLCEPLPAQCRPL